MASGDTKTEAMLNVLGNGGSGDEFRGCCNTKTQSYILDAIDRINAIQPGGSSDFNDLSNRPQLNGTQMTGNTNITNFTGTDGTAAGAQGLVPAPAATDADKFLKSDGTWATAGGGYVLPTASSETLGGVKVGNNLSIDANGVLSAQGGGGGITTLTSADYNWKDAQNRDAIALWLLPSGIYYVENGFTTLVYIGANLRDYDCPHTYMINDEQSDDWRRITVFGQGTNENGEGQADLMMVYSVYLPSDHTANLSDCAFTHSQYTSKILPMDLWSDYADYPSEDPDGVALWNLGNGKWKAQDTLKAYYNNAPESSTIPEGSTIEIDNVGSHKYINFMILDDANTTIIKGFAVTDTSGNKLSHELYSHTAA